MVLRGRGEDAEGELGLLASLTVTMTRGGGHAGEPCSGELRIEGRRGALGSVSWEWRGWCVRRGGMGWSLYRRVEVTAGGRAVYVANG
jgi:hypothetical protein